MARRQSVKRPFQEPQGKQKEVDPQEQQQKVDDHLKELFTQEDASKANEHEVKPQQVQPPGEEPKQQHPEQPLLQAEQPSKEQQPEPAAQEAEQEGSTPKIKNISNMLNETHMENSECVSKLWNILPKEEPAPANDEEGPWLA